MRGVPKQDASWEMVVALGKVIKWEMVAEGLMREKNEGSKATKSVWLKCSFLGLRRV